LIQGASGTVTADASDTLLDVQVRWSPAPPAEWRALEKASPAPTFFQKAVWLQSILKTFPDQQGLWLTVSRAGRMLGGMSLSAIDRGPLKTIHGSFSGTAGDPLLVTDLDDRTRTAVIDALAAKLRRLSRQAWVLELNLFLGDAADRELHRTLDRLGATRLPVSASRIPLAGGLEAVESAYFHRTRRKERNRALREGCTTEVSDDPAVIDEYYPIHLEASRRWQTAPLPRELFETLLADGGGRAYMSCVRYQGRLMGAHLNLQGDEVITAWNGCTAADDNDKHPATLLIWQDIQEAVARGAAVLDLGAHGDNDGVANFKKVIGAEDVTRDHYRFQSPLGRLARGALGLVRGRLFS
jgi:CelD/BcsL family acetyltransferase involved in cellulose biosynthesis